MQAGGSTFGPASPSAFPSSLEPPPSPSQDSYSLPSPSYRFSPHPSPSQAQFSRLPAAETAILSSRNTVSPTSTITPLSLHTLLDVSPDIEDAGLHRMFVADVDRRRLASTSTSHQVDMEWNELRETVSRLLDPDAQRAYDADLHRDGEFDPPTSTEQDHVSGIVQSSTPNPVLFKLSATPSTPTMPSPTAPALWANPPCSSIPDDVLNNALQAQRRRRSAMGPRTPVGETFNTPPLSTIPVLHTSPTSSPTPPSISPTLPSPGSPFYPVPLHVPPPLCGTASPQPQLSRDHPFLRTEYVRGPRIPPPPLTPSLAEAEAASINTVRNPSASRKPEPRQLHPSAREEEDMPRCLRLRLRSKKAKLAQPLGPISPPFGFVHLTHADPPSPSRLPTGRQNSMVAGLVVTKLAPAPATWHPRTAAGMDIDGMPNTFGRASVLCPQSRRSRPAIDVLWAHSMAVPSPVTVQETPGTQRSHAELAQSPSLVGS
ncbi:hypothetical protein CspeluHIS016_0308390 [Cutaneotrichosporon spelunceum]|uniref:Uncharacterized protein n=1 Tax=Cutaneotrichosporon spelunceum TaxID=1672016 RepID=A0AAD3TUC6_9TREE|nr:hypothetical protein CspeluHIS016_0308390 [Cutaneotrichosporon spelunceum]